jgi:hypothetical protein
MMLSSTLTLNSARSLKVRVNAHHRHLVLFMCLKVCPRKVMKIPPYTPLMQLSMELLPRAVGADDGAGSSCSRTLNEMFCSALTPKTSEMFFARRG